MKKLLLALVLLLCAINAEAQQVPPGNLVPVIAMPPGCPNCLPVVLYDVNGNPVSTLGGGMSAVTANAPLTGLGTSISPLGITQAGAGANGYLSSTDWSTFNAKQSALTFSNSVSLSGSTVTLTNDQASPGPSKYYGTDTGGAKGYFALPTGTSGATVFTGLLDVPNSYVGKGDYFVKVNTAANGLTFVQPPAGAGNVTGPVSATDSQLVLFSGTSGTLLKGASGAGIPKLTGAGVLSSVSTIDTADITNSAVTFAKFQNISSGVVLGRTTTGAGTIEQLTPGPGITFVSGTITNSGVVSVVGTAGQINTSGTTGNVTLSLPATLGVAITGNAATATALGANGTNCGPGQAAQGVDAAGNAEGCFTPSAGGSGNVIGPATNTINRIPQWSGTNNLTLKDGLDVASSNAPSNIVQRDASGNFSAGTITATLTGNASTASALAANGTNCGAGQAAQGVDASGNAEGCFTPSGAGNVATGGTLTSGQLVIGQGAQSVAVGNLTGDVTTSGSTATTIANLAVTNAKIANTTIDLTTKVTGLLPAANINQANNYAWTGAQDMSGATSHTVPIGAAAAPTSSGQIAYNSTTNTWRAGVNGVSKTIAMTDSAITGNAATATALAADGTNCAAGQAAAGIDASGNAQGCFTPSGSGNVIGPATNTDSFIPQWNGANSNILKNGLAVASINTASAVVQRDGSGNFSAGTITATLSGTATSLAANGSNCSAGQFPLGVDASGNAETCTPLPTSIAGTTNQITASASTGSITLSIPSSAQLSIANLTNLTSNGVVTTSGGTGAISVTQATSSNTPSTIVQRDASGNFSGGTITATTFTGALSGNATTATALAANGTNCGAGQAAAGVDASGNAEGCFAVGSGTGDVVGPGSSVDNHIVQFSGTTGKLVKDGLAVASANTASAVVQRDASGNFSANIITAALTGNASTASALAANGNNCTATQAAIGVDTFGNAEGCWSPGNVSGPGTNTDSFVPQWNGANSNLLKNGFAVSTTPGANTIVLADASGVVSASWFPNAAADGTTKGVATFAAADFNTTTGNVSLDYTNGQKATASLPGFLSSADWTTFNGKQAAGNYVTALTGDVSGSGPGSTATTIAANAVTNTKIANGTIDLTQKVTGRLPVANVNAAALNGSVMYAVDTGTTNAFVITLTEAPAAYVTGAVYRFKAASNVTGPSTINVNGLGAKTLKKMSGGILLDTAGQDIVAGQMVELFYDGTVMQVLGAPAPSPTPSLQQVATVGATYNGADSFAHAVKLGTGNDGFAAYVHTTKGPQLIPFCSGVENGCDHIIGLNSGFVLSVRNSTNVDIFRLSESACGSLAQGAVMYYTGSTWECLAPGTSGQFLQTAGAAANPVWATAGGGGLTQRVEAISTADQSIANSTDTLVTWNSETYDTDTMHDNVTNNSRLTFKTAGTYIVSGMINWAGNATGDNRYMAIRQQPGSVLVYQKAGPATAIAACAGACAAHMPFSLVVQAAVNDYVEITVNQNSGGSLALQQSSTNGARFSAVRIQ